MVPLLGGSGINWKDLFPFLLAYVGRLLLIRAAHLDDLLVTSSAERELVGR